MCVYADDTALFYHDKSVNIVQSQLQSTLDKVLTWINNNKLILNVKKTERMLIGSSPKIKNKSPDFYVNRERVKQVTEFKDIGLQIDSSLRWNKHVDMICNKISQRIGFIRRIKHFLPRHILILLYNTLVLPHLDNYNAIWGLSASYNIAKLKKKEMQNRYACLVLNAHYMTPHSSMLSELAWHSVKRRFYYQVGLTMFKIQNGFLPEYLKNIIIPNKSTYCTRYNAHSTLFVRTLAKNRLLQTINALLWLNLMEQFTA